MRAASSLSSGTENRPMFCCSIIYFLAFGRIMYKHIEPKHKKQESCDRYAFVWFFVIYEEQ